ncbi:MAG: DUF5615 family PIN-like protein [Phormidesmis sp.]
MARLYADEMFPAVVSTLLGELDHDVLTVQAAGQGNQRIPDHEVLAYAVRCNRAVVTMNRNDFARLHRRNSNHAGIILCSEDRNRAQLANRINAAILKEQALAGKLIRVNRPQQ